jgi:hypothetical protein
MLIIGKSDRPLPVFQELLLRAGAKHQRRVCVSGLRCDSHVVEDGAWLMRPTFESSARQPIRSRVNRCAQRNLAENLCSCRGWAARKPAASANHQQQSENRREDFHATERLKLGHPACEARRNSLLRRTLGVWSARSGSPVNPTLPPKTRCGAW